MNLWQPYSADQEKWNLTLGAPSCSLPDRQAALRELHERGALPAQPLKSYERPWIQKLLEADRSAEGHTHTQVLIADLMALGHSLDAVWRGRWGEETALSLAVTHLQGSHVQHLLALGANPNGPPGLIQLALTKVNELQRGAHHKQPGPTLEAVMIPLLRHGATPERGQYLSPVLRSVVELHPLLNPNSRVTAETVDRLLDAFLDAKVKLNWPLTADYAKAMVRLLSVATPGQFQRIVPQLNLDQPEATDTLPSLRQQLALVPALQARLRHHELNLRPVTRTSRNRPRS